MIELISSVEQTVPVNGAVQFDTVVTKGGCAESHRNGSAQIKLNKPGRYLITFSGNIAVPTGQTVGEVSLAIALGGENINGTIMRATPAAVDQFFNASSQTYVTVNCNCCETITIKNAATIPVLVDNPNITAVRVCG